MTKPTVSKQLYVHSCLSQAALHCCNHLWTQVVCTRLKAHAEMENSIPPPGKTLTPEISLLNPLHPAHYHMQILVSISAVEVKYNRFVIFGLVEHVTDKTVINSENAADSPWLWEDRDNITNDQHQPLRTVTVTTCLGHTHAWRLHLQLTSPS